MNKDGGKPVHGDARRGHKTSEYYAWINMRTRCGNPKYNGYLNYGGRGIAVCERWDSYENFLADMGRKPEGASLDRIDNSKGYSPENCRWTTRTEQTRNSRRFKLNSEAILCIRGALMQGRTQRELAKLYGISQSRVASVSTGLGIADDLFLDAVLR